jgi:hypothetical protein
MSRTDNKNEAMQKLDQTINPEEILVTVFARLDRLALGLATGIVGSATIFLGTIILVLKGGDPLGPNMVLLRQYIPQYSVSWHGSLIGAAGGFIAGFSIGWSIAFLRNLILATYLFACAFWARLNRFLDDV